MPALICIRYWVSGRVQGVWFRAYTKDKAQKLGLTGYAKNLEDGRVEVVACGEQEKIQQLEGWLKKGPPLAKVTALNIEELPFQTFETFETR